MFTQINFRAFINCQSALAKTRFAVTYIICRLWYSMKSTFWCYGVAIKSFDKTFESSCASCATKMGKKAIGSWQATKISIWDTGTSDTDVLMMFLQETVNFGAFRQFLARITETSRVCQRLIFRRCLDPGSSSDLCIFDTFMILP